MPAGLTRRDQVGAADGRVDDRDGAEPPSTGPIRPIIAVGVVRQRGVVAEDRLARRDREQVRTEPVELGQQGRPARFGDAEDRHHRRDPDRDAERRERRTEPARARGRGRRSGPDRARPDRGRPTSAVRTRTVGRGHAATSSCLDPTVADLDPTRQRGRDLAVVGDDDDRGAVLGVELAKQVEDRRAGRSSRGCRSARRRARAPAGRRAPGRSRRAGARRRTAAPGRCVSRCPSPTRSSAAAAAARRRSRRDARGRAGRRRRCRARSRRPAGRTAGTRTRSATPAARTAAGRTARPTRCPAIRDRPARSRRSSVPSRWSSVDLPDPDGPTIATSSPASMRRSTSRSASTGGVARVPLRDAVQLDNRASRRHRDHGVALGQSPSAR